MKLTMAIIAALSLLVLGGLRGCAYIQFNRNCEGHLKRAGDANTVELALQEMKIAVKYLEDNEMTEGFTSIIYTTPDEDMGFFYQNLKASVEELQKVTPETPQLERSNVLMKLRETLLDGDEVTIPEGASVFPYNKSFAVWGLLSVLFLVIFGGLAILEY